MVRNCVLHTESPKPVRQVQVPLLQAPPFRQVMPEQASFVLEHDVYITALNAPITMSTPIATFLIDFIK